MYRRFIFFFATALLLLSSCGRNAARRGKDVADTVQFKYAEHITMLKYDGYTVVTLSDPWHDGKTLDTYILVERKDSARMKSLPHGTVVYVPVDNSVVFTAPHCSLMSMIGANEAIKGVCDSRYIHSDWVAKGVESGLITDCGDSMSPQVEKIIGLHPQAILLSPFDNSGHNRLERLRIPIIECADYMETSALGRAEWMRFYGLLFGKQETADSLFAVVEQRYDSLRTLARQSKINRSILTERKTSGVWYCPGGRSSMGKLIADANGGYAFAADEHSGSLSLAPEKVIYECANADVWTFIHDGNNIPTLSSLLQEYRGYSQIKAYQEGEVYGCDSRNTAYFDEISFRPDYLLADFIALLHPDVNTGKPLRYYKKIEKN